MVGKYLFTNAKVGDIQAFQVFKRNPNKFGFFAQDFARKAMVLGPGGVSPPDSIVRLPNSVFFAQHTYKSMGNIVHM